MRIGLLSDLHYDIAPSRERAWINSYEPLGLEQRLDAAVRIFTRDRPDLILLLGDTAERGDRKSFDRVFARLQELNGSRLLQSTSGSAGSIAIATVAGNHDVASDSSDVGEGALASSARLREIRFLNADTARVSDLTLLGVGIEATTAGGATFRGALRAPPRNGPLTIVASHFPLLSHAAEIIAARLPHSGDLVNRVDLETELQSARVPTLALSGHVHARCSASSGYVLQLTVGAMIESPFDCTTVDTEFRDDGAILVRRRVHTLGTAAAVNPVFAPEDERWAWSGDRWEAGAG
jgi:predicted phosphodiesterase